jgi:hypothetical protein
MAGDTMYRISYRIFQISIISFIAIALSGCVIAVGNTSHSEEDKWHVRQERNSSYINQLDLGLSMTTVESDLGSADYNESFQRDGEAYQVLYYRTRQVHSDGKTTKDETTPLVFMDRKLIGWGEIAIEKATR